MIETIYTNHKEVACNGGVLGHPLVYLNMAAKSEIVCPYCSKKFILKQDLKINSHAKSAD